MKTPGTLTEKTNGHNGPRLLGPNTLDLHQWPSLDHRNYKNDVAVMAVTSGVGILRHFYAAIAMQKIETTNIAVLAGASTTPGDLDPVEQIARGHPEAIQTSKGLFPVRKTYHPNSPLVLTKRLDRGLVSGMECDPLKAMEVMQSNPLFLKDVREFSDMVVAHCQSHHMVGVKGVYFGGFGGTEPVERAAVSRVEAQVRPNWRVRVKLLPTAEEPLGLANARGESYRLIGNGVADNELVIVKQNVQRGAHHDDDALVNGLITLTGNAPNGRESDGATLLRMLRRAGCGWVDVRPAVVWIPLRKVGKQWLFWGKDYLVKVPEEDGGRVPELLITKAREMLAREPDAFHVLTIAGLFTDEEMRDLKTAVMNLLGPGHVVPVVNRLYPQVEGETGRWTMCDFVTAPELPGSVMRVFESAKSAYRGSGLSPQEFLERVKPPEELETAERVARFLEDMVI